MEKVSAAGLRRAGSILKFLIPDLGRVNKFREKPN